MDAAPFAGWGLKSVALTDRAKFNAYFESLSTPLSDYTFSQLFSWSNSLRILWTELDGNLCVFANGTGDLTMLMPPIGDGACDKALASAYEMMDAYNVAADCPDHGRVEYCSEELLARFSPQGMIREPASSDYIYDVQRMIDLAGGDLASKRQSKNRFMRNYEYRVERYDAARHLDHCLALLWQWKQFQDSAHTESPSLNNFKRQKEALATELSLRHAEALGYAGMVVYVNGGPKEFTADGVALPVEPGWRLAGFTFGEPLGTDQSSIVIEKTDLRYKGLTQFIFSEFCREHWAHRPLTNVGDDWGLESLAWTKQSYRPVKLLPKFTFRREAVAKIAIPSVPAAAMEAPSMQITPENATVDVRVATRDDVEPAVELEKSCFSTYCLSKRQLQYLQHRPTAVFLVAECEGKLVGEGVALVRHHRTGSSGRIYSLAVDSNYRGRKIGQKLMQRLIAELEQRGVKRIFLEVEQTNTSAIGLYERMGFRQIGVMADYYGAGRPGVHMLYELPVVAPAPLAA